MVFHAILIGLSSAAAAPPRVVEMSPANGASDVALTVRELRVVFDRDMSTNAYSFCGGGPSFPQTVGRPRWADKRTIVMQVTLEPDHDYHVSLNCPSAKGFRSAEGVPIAPVPWNFSTAPDKPKLTKASQTELNARSLEQLMQVLRNHYSYYERRGIDWAALEQRHREEIVGSNSTRSWVKRVAAMLSTAEDMHLWLTYRGSATYTYAPNVVENFDLQRVRKSLPGLRRRNGVVHTSRTEDNIGYIVIDSLMKDRAEQIEQVQDYLTEFKDCRGLIIDLRPNGGGAESLARPIAAWFVSGRKIYARNVTRDSDVSGGFTGPYERTITGNDPPRRFDKPVAVLSGPGVMSSAEAFLLMLKQADNVTVIGEPSYGGSGNPHPHTLENGVEVFVPSWKAMRPDRTCFEGEGIKPDITVKAAPSESKGNDQVIERALEHLRSVSSGAKHD